MIVTVSSSRACEISNHGARLSAQGVLLPDGLLASGVNGIDLSSFSRR